MMTMSTGPSCKLTWWLTHIPWRPHSWGTSRMYGGQNIIMVCWGSMDTLCKSKHKCGHWILSFQLEEHYAFNKIKVCGQTNGLINLSSNWWCSNTILVQCPVQDIWIRAQQEIRVYHYVNNYQDKQSTWFKRLNLHGWGCFLCCIYE